MKLMQELIIKQKVIEDILDLNGFPKKEYVKLGEIIMTENPEKYDLLGIGTCLGIYMFDLKKSKFLMAHTMLPEYKEHISHNNPELPGRYTDMAIQNMLHRLKREGSINRDIKVRIAGGGQIYQDSLKIGARNIEMAHQILADEGIEILAEDIGGNTGRSILEFFKDGTLFIKKNGQKYTI